MRSKFWILLLLFSCQAENQETEYIPAVENRTRENVDIEKSTYNANDTFVYQEFSLTDVEISMFWKDNLGYRIKNSEGLLEHLGNDSSNLIFAMNGGMYLEDGSPQGLFIDNGNVLNRINSKKSSYGNFYLEPNGVFAISMNNVATVSKSSEFNSQDSTLFATQSGPMLLIDGKYHSAFSKGSSNTHFRNGVGITKDGRVILAQSKMKVNFYDFATFFKNKNCRNALYLDGFVSRTYAPQQKWKQLDGDFGVIIGVLKKKLH